MTFSFMMMLFGMLSSCIALRAAESLKVRLDTPLSSYLSRDGAEVRATVIAPWVKDGRLMIPAHSKLHGMVHQARGVGMGIVRERARIDLSFDVYELPDGRKFAFSASVVSVDNAREDVTMSGRIRGILAADNPQGFIHGVWMRPTPVLFQRSALGLTGAAGRIWTGFDLGPMGATALFALRCALFRLPEPEIHLPVGTEMRLRVTQVVGEAPSTPKPTEETVSPEMASQLELIPYEVTKENGTPAADMINVALVGTAEEVRNAFEQAGWVEAEPKSAGSFARTYKAFTAASAYPAAPVSMLLHDDAVPDLVYQKSLNTISKRHHIRIWQRGTTADGRGLWVGAATHDIGMGRRSGTLMATHKIDLRIDRERGKVVNDFLYSGCADSVRYLDRPEATRRGDGVATVITDGRLGVLELHGCRTSLGIEDPEWTPLPGSMASRMARRAALETRQYLVRGNVYRWGFRALRLGRSRPEPEADSMLEH